MAVSQAQTLHYLTVQDILWLNLQITRKVQAFTYSRLEEATFYQYAYGDSRGLVSQAAQFLVGFNNLKPFASGNPATAFVGCMAFLRVNGFLVDVDDEKAAGWANEIRAAESHAPDMLNRVVKEDPEFHHGLNADVREAVRDVMATYPKTIERLSRERVGAEK